MFERFTERAQQVVVLAQDEARSLGHGRIGTEHLLLGLLREEEGLAARVLDRFDVTLEEVRTQVERVGQPGGEAATGMIPFTSRATNALELARAEGLSLGHNYVGTEHILLSLTREGEGTAMRILLDFDLDAEAIRHELVAMLSGPPRPRPRPTPEERDELAAELNGEGPSAGSPALGGRSVDYGPALVSVRVVAAVAALVAFVSGLVVGRRIWG